MEYFMPLDQGHVPCGPIHVQGVHLGMTLSVRINQILTGAWRWSRVGGEDPDHLGHIHFKGGEHFLTWRIDGKKGTCTSHLGHSIPLSPFMGVMAVASDTDNYVRTYAPGLYGANMDCKDMTAGSVLYLPVYAEGALFSTGDGHARQDDGESGCTAIECPMECVSLISDLIDEPLASPVCDSLKGWITFDFHSDLTETAYCILIGMCHLMERLYGFSSKETLAITNVAVNVRVTQLVNGMRGAHALLPHDTITL